MGGKIALEVDRVGVLPPGILSLNRTHTHTIGAIF